MDALILGATPNSLSAARSLGRAGLEVVIAATDTDHAVARSPYVSRFELLEAMDERAIESCLMRLPAPGEKPFLLATGDQDSLLVAKHQARLREKYCFVCPPYDVLEVIVNKASLYEAAALHGIPHPLFHVVREVGDIDIAIAKVQTPCYVKPALAHEWRRIRRGKLEWAETAEELRRILSGNVATGLVAIPIEIIPGGDSEVYSVSTYIDRSGSAVGWRTKRKLRQYPLNAGNGCAQEICNEPEVAALGLRLLAVTGHRGPATVEFRRDERDGRFVLMEINARTILGQELITRSGFDVPLIAYHDAKGLPLPPMRQRWSRLRWVFLGDDFRAFRQLRENGFITTRQWLASVATCNVFAYFAPGDPGPFLARIAMWLGRRFKGRARRRGAAVL